MNKPSANKSVTDSVNSKPVDWFKGIGILLLVGWIAYYFIKDDSPKVPLRSDYSIVETSLNARRGFNITVRIQEKKEDAQLIAIARNVKEISNTISDTGLVFLLLPEMVNDNGAWASVKFNPEPVVNIIGLSIADEMTIRNNIDSIKDYIGLWIDNGSNNQLIIRLRKDKKYKYVLENISITEPGRNEFASPLIHERINGKNVFRFSESATGDYFIFNTNGDMDVYDNSGYITTYKLLKLSSQSSE